MSRVGVWLLIGGRVTVLVRLVPLLMRKAAAAAAGGGGGGLLLPATAGGLLLPCCCCHMWWYGAQLLPAVSGSSLPRRGSIAGAGDSMLMCLCDVHHQISAIVIVLSMTMMTMQSHSHTNIITTVQ